MRISRAPAGLVALFVLSAVMSAAIGDSVVRFNPVTKKMLTWPIPSGGGTVRNMDIDKNGRASCRERV